MTQTRCCVFTPDESANAASLTNLMRTQALALSDPTPNLLQLLLLLLSCFSRVRLCATP